MARPDGRIGHGFDLQHLAGWQLAHGAHGFGVAIMADVDQLDAGLMVPTGFAVDLGNQGAGGIDGDHPTLCCLGRH